MILAIVGLALGLVLGFFFPLSLPAAFMPYAGPLLLSLFFAFLHGARRQRQGQFIPMQFIMLLAGGVIFAAMMTFAGKRLELALNLGAAFAFCVGMLIDGLALIEEPKINTSPSSKHK